LKEPESNMRLINRRRRSIRTQPSNSKFHVPPGSRQRLGRFSFLGGTARQVLQPRVKILKRNEDSFSKAACSEVSCRDLLANFARAARHFLGGLIDSHCKTILHFIPFHSARRLLLACATKVNQWIAISRRGRRSSRVVARERCYEYVEIQSPAARDLLRAGNLTLL
jgi:hypothetical protein